MESVDDTARPASLGEVIARERERQGLSRSEIAQRLHMSATQVEALELDAYDRLPKGTFLRGFVRNYAKQLNIEAEPLLARLHEVAPHPPAPRIVVPSQNIRFDPIGDRLANPYMRAAVLAAVVIAVALAAMYWWVFIKNAGPVAVARKPVELGPPQQLAAAPVSAPEAPPPVEAPKAEVPKAEAPKAEAPKVDAPKVDATKVQPAKVEAPKLEPSPAPTVPPVAAKKPGDRTLKFRFKGESWVEIKDARGRTLMSQLNGAGTEAEVAGRPPFTVIVGNAPEVQLLYEDRAFALEPHTRVAVARFTLE